MTKWTCIKFNMETTEMRTVILVILVIPVILVILVIPVILVILVSSAGNNTLLTCLQHCLIIASILEAL